MSFSGYFEIESSGQEFIDCNVKGQDLDELKKNFFALCERLGLTTGIISLVVYESDQESSKVLDIDLNQPNGPLIGGLTGQEVNI